MPPLLVPAVRVPELAERLSQCGGGDAVHVGAAPLAAVRDKVNVALTGEPPAEPLKFSAAGATVKVLGGAAAAALTVSVTGKATVDADGDTTVTVPE